MRKINFFSYQELALTSKDWIVEQVKVIPIDDGELNTSHKSYMIYRQHSNDTFILDLKLNKNFNPNVLIQYDNIEMKTQTTNCLFYTGSVRHWGKVNSMIAISICSSLVS